MMRTCRAVSRQLPRLRHRSYATASGSSLAEISRKWNGRLVLSEEVGHALHTQSPVIALETAIVTHGMPYPSNYDTARSVETIIRDGQVTPATIALVGGKIHVGLTDKQLQEISDPGFQSVKVSRRDLAPVLSQDGNGGTTVAGTMYIAQSVGIPLFVTGGIGGVHRGAESSMDVSADLIELGRTPMGVVCAGAKSILDIPRTLEVLETQGVCVASYGQKDFPAFYTPSAGVKSPWSVPTASAAASLIHTGLTLPNPLATLLAVPPPVSQTGEQVQQAVEQAVRESVEQGIDKRGKEATPWLLKRVGELTGGSALQLNIALIENNAKVGAEVAREMAKVAHASTMSAYMPAVPSASPSPSTSPTPPSAPAHAQAGPVTVQVFGSAAIDITTRPSIPLQPGTTTPGSITLTPGGVGRNIAEAAQNLLPAGAVQLVSTVGAEHCEVAAPETEVDGFGKVLMAEMSSAGLRTDGLLSRGGYRTAGCTLSLGMEGDLNDGVADMGIIESLDPATVSERIRAGRPKMVVFDCNILPGCISAILSTAHELGIATFCDPTSTPKLPRLVSALSLSPKHDQGPTLTHLSPNLLELDLLYSLLQTTISDTGSDRAWEYINSLGLLGDFRAKLETWTNRADANRGWIAERGVVQQAIGLLPFTRNLWIKCGNRGLIHIHVSERLAAGQNREGATLIHRLPGQLGHLMIRHYAPLHIKEEDVVSTTGAGDTLVGGLVAGLLDESGEKEEVWVQTALERVGRTMRSQRAVG